MTLLLALIALVQTTGADAYPPDADCQEYRDGSTMAMSECLLMQASAWQRRLEQEYRSAVARAEVDVAELEAAQEAWLRYRDSNCQAYGTVEGSISRILAPRCWRDMTRARTLELREMSWTG